MHRAHKIRLNPTPEQADYFRRVTGTQGFVFNWGLAQIKEALDAGDKPPPVLALKKTFHVIKGEHFPWVYDVRKCAGAERRRRVTVFVVPAGASSGR